MNHNDAKDRLYSLWADTAKAFASPKRLELLDLLSQGERSVEALARESRSAINNTSAHLAVLKSARLVETRKVAQFVLYRLADDGVVGLLHGLQAVTRHHNFEVDHLVRAHFEGRDALEAVDAAELHRRLSAGEVTVVDVRPALEYEAGHIAGALSVPLNDFDAHVRHLPGNRAIVAYCRGPYCVMAAEAVERFRGLGYDAQRFAGGVPHWRMAGLPVAAGAGNGDGGGARGSGATSVRAAKPRRRRGRS